MRFVVYITHSLTAALDQLRVVASSTSNDPCPRSRQHQQIGQCLLPLAAANFFVDDPADASSQRPEECRCGLLLTVAVPAKQVCSPVGDRCDQIMNDVCQQYIICCNSLYVFLYVSEDIYLGAGATIGIKVCTMVDL